MERRRWIAGLAPAGVAAAFPLQAAVHARVGSGHGCEGIGFGCTPERFFDTALVLAVYAVGLALTAAVAWRGGARFGRRLAVGIVLTLLAAGAATAAQRPQHAYARGDLASGLGDWQAVVDDGRRAAGPGTPLAAAIGALRRSGPEPCRDGYGRRTGAARHRWHAPPQRYDDPGNARTGPGLERWAARLRARGLPARMDRATPESSRLTLGFGAAPANGGTLSVRASAYIPELEITVATGCHRP